MNMPGAGPIIIRCFEFAPAAAAAADDSSDVEEPKYGDDAACTIEACKAPSDGGRA